MNTDTKSHLAKTPEKCLQEAERANKNMYLEACLQQRQHLLAFASSGDEVLGVEAGGYPENGRQPHCKKMAATIL